VARHQGDQESPPTVRSSTWRRAGVPVASRQVYLGPAQNSCWQLHAEDSSRCKGDARAVSRQPPAQVRVWLMQIRVSPLASSVPKAVCRHERQQRECEGSATTSSAAKEIAVARRSRQKTTFPPQARTRRARSVPDQRGRSHASFDATSVNSPFTLAIKRRAFATWSLACVWPSSELRFPPDRGSYRDSCAARPSG
jgi:hypothetical protein